MTTRLPLNELETIVSTSSINPNRISWQDGVKRRMCLVHLFPMVLFSDIHRKSFFTQLINQPHEPSSKIVKFLRPMKVYRKDVLIKMLRKLKILQRREVTRLISVMTTKTSRCKRKLSLFILGLSADHHWK